MSGVSPAAAPRTHSHSHSDQKSPQDVMESLRMIDLQLIAFITVFSASGLVHLFDLLFPAFTTAYLLLLSRLAFPDHGAGKHRRIQPQPSRAFRLYAMLGSVVGLYLPLAYVLGGFARGDEHAVGSGTPHLFLLSFQILTENVVNGLNLFSGPVRALVPLLYTTRRIFVMLDWVRDEWVDKTLPANAQIKDIAWYWFGRSLAAANLGYFVVNLFGYLIPRFLPRAFEQYFKQRDEIRLKSAQDKQQQSNT